MTWLAFALEPCLFAKLRNLPKVDQGALGCPGPKLIERCVSRVLPDPKQGTIMSETQRSICLGICLGFVLGVMAGQFIHLHW